MKLVIDIPEDTYNEIHSLKYLMHGLKSEENRQLFYQLINTINDGTPLPKDRGRWLVLSEAKVKENLMKVDFSCQKWISEVNLSFATFAIIEADKTESEK